MINLNEYMQDGAGAQARAVLAYLQSYGGSIEESWNLDLKDYMCKIIVGRWENCREQGYCFSLRVGNKQQNIVVFEHRNGDGICMVVWEQYTINTPTIDNATFEGTNYRHDKYAVSKRFGYGEASEAAEWISGEFLRFYRETKKSNA